MLKLLHIRTNNRNFFDATVEAYDLAEFDNTYLINAPVEEHKYWGSKGNNVRAVTSADLLHTVDKIEHDILVVHYISGRSAQVIRHAGNSCRLIVWSSWGCDYQELIGNHEKVLLLPETRRIVRSCDLASWQGVAQRVREQAAAVVRNRLIRQALPYIDVMTHVQPDFDRMKAMYPEIRAVQHRVGYYSIGSSFQADKVNPGATIQIGNSADPCMNHAESFAAIRPLWDGRSPILCPLSYGDQRYADRIEALGYATFGQQFKPLREFLPLKTYNEIVGQSGAFFLNSIRQKAIGNIALALYQGRAVFLHRDNPLHHTFREIGVTLFTMEDAIRSGVAPHRMLTQEGRENNRRVIAEHFSREALQKRARVFQELYNAKQRTT